MIRSRSRLHASWARDSRDASPATDKSTSVCPMHRPFAISTAGWRMSVSIIAFLPRDRGEPSHKQHVTDQFDKLVCRAKTITGNPADQLPTNDTGRPDRCRRAANTCDSIAPPEKKGQKERREK